MENTHITRELLKVCVEADGQLKIRTSTRVSGLVFTQTRVSMAGAHSNMTDLTLVSYQSRTHVCEMVVKEPS